jgi:hypothetical protein
MTSPREAYPAPAEGLPPCLSTVLFDGRVANIVDGEACGQEHHPWRFQVTAGKITRRDEVPDMHGFRCWWIQPVVNVYTDAPDEAAAAFERGREYVRTGRME